MISRACVGQLSARTGSASRISTTSASPVSALPWTFRSPTRTRLVVDGSASRARPREDRRGARRPSRPCSAASSVGSSSTARRKRWRAAWFASRASARRPASSSVVGRLASQIGRRSAVQLGQQRGRVIEVVRADLEQLVAGPSRAATRRTRLVLRRAADLVRLAYATSRISTCLKRYARLVRERRARLADDEVAQQQVLDRARRRSRRSARYSIAPAQKLRPIDRRALKNSLRRGLQPVDARRDQRLQRVRDLARRRAPRRTRRR